MKIYTKTGDKGETSLIGGKRVPKFHDRIEAYGTLDELNSYIGLVADLNIDVHTKSVLMEIQDRIFTAESLLASEDPTEHQFIPKLSEDNILLLEKEIDRMNEDLPELNSFILPGGHITSSHCHIARCICRKSERFCIKLAQNHHIDPLIIKYLNRLSDYLFVLARKLIYDNKAVEKPWQARV